MLVDYLIVGQGLAGSLLAWELIQREARVMVVDQACENASRVAAGIINPITGLRLVKNRDVETLLPTALSCYQALSAYFNQPFFRPRPLIRLIQSQAELDQCRRRAASSEYGPYIDKLHPANDPFFEGRLTAPFGYLGQSQTGHLLTGALLDSLQQYFIDSGCYRRGQVDHATIASQDMIVWQGIQARRVIFCEGHQGRDNPWFGDLPFQVAKGEILTLVTTARLPNAIINFGHWLLPVGDGKVKLGATFDSQHLDTRPTGAGKDALLGTLDRYANGLAVRHIVRHQAGIRPCTKDRQPFLGFHPVASKIGIFNGFGAKGSLQIPYFARQFANLLIDRQPLPPHCDISRYYSRRLPA